MDSLNHVNKGTDQVRYFNDDVCGFKTPIATECVHNTIRCEKHTLTHTEDSSTVSPGDETQDYECRHENKGTNKVWCFNDDVCGFETKKATESVHNTITCEKHTLTHTEAQGH